MEYTNMLVWDNFKFGELIRIGKNIWLPKPTFREIIDPVYVAVTGTKEEKLVLTDAAEEYLKWLETKSDESRNGVS